MKYCCPPGHGCNDPDGNEPCALSLCGREADEDADAATAVARWEEWQAVCQASHTEAERRFRRRAFQRARDQALISLALRRNRRQRRPIGRRHLASV